MAWYDVFVRKTAQPAEQRQLTIPFDVGGVSVNADDNAMRLVPMFAAVSLIADSVSSLPIHCYRDANGTRSPVTAPSLVQSPHPHELFGRWIHKALVSLLLHGNAFGFVLERDGYGFPTSIEWLDPNAVTVESDLYRVNGTAIPRDDMVHVRWTTLPGSNVGYSPMDVARFTVRTGTGSMKYGADWFDNGGIPPGTFVNTDKSLTAEEAGVTAERLRASIKRGRPIVYGKDWTYTPIQIPPDQAQFIQTNKMTATQIAAIYRIPAVMIGGDPGGALTYSSPEQDTNSFITHCLRPWMVLLEETLNSLLPSNVYVKFNADSLIRVDTLTRMQAYQLQRAMGLRNVDELRALEDLPPLPNGEGQDYSPLPPASGPGTTPPQQSGPPKEPA